MHLGGGEESGGLDIPAAPKGLGGAQPPQNYSQNSPSGGSTPPPPPFKAYVPQASAPPAPVVVAASGNLQQYYAQSPPPSFSRPPIANNDPRVQDTVELCNFAILALKVTITVVLQFFGYFERIYLVVCA